MLNIKVPLIKRVFFIQVLSVAFWSMYAHSAPLEDIALSEKTETVVATIKLSSPVANVRYTPASKGSSLSILLDKVPSGTANEEWLDNETLRSPPSSLIPSFTVKTNLKNLQPKLIIDFSREAEYTVQMGRDGRSIIINIKIIASPPEPKVEKISQKFDGTLPFLPEVKSLEANASDINKQAADLMLRGRNALASSDNVAAIDAFNKLLLLPPNTYTQDGQEWVGVARERAKQLDKAKLEFEVYLKLYTNPEDTKRIKLRLATLGSKPVIPASVTAERATQKKQTTQTLTYGSVSMHYYQGNSKIDTLDTSGSVLSGNQQNKFTFSAMDQSALLTSVMATSRFISEGYDNRVVFQDTAYSNFLPGQTDKNRLSAAYFEVKNKLSDYSIRIGRQSSSGGGVMGRFDGATAGYGISPSLRINAVGGQLSDLSIGSKPVFYGVSADMGPVSIYAINQTVDQILDRRAIGTELRYFDPNKSAFALFDYDTIFSALNVAMIQGTFTPSPETTFNLFLDRRRTPYLTTKNALNGALTTSLRDLLEYVPMSEEDIRTLAADRTGTSNMAQIGVLQQVSPKWQIGGDLRVSKFEAMPASGLSTQDPNLPDPTPTLTGLQSEMPSSGNEIAVSPQFVGSNLYSSRDVTVFSISFLSSALYKGQSFYIYSRGNLTDKWTLDASLQLYRQNYEIGTVMTRTVPMLRTAYQVRQSISLDMDLGVEISHTESASQTSDGQRQFFSLGFRWDF